MHGYVTALASPAAAWLLACDGELAVIDSLDQQGSNLQSDDSNSSDDPAETPPPRTGGCACTSSPSLQPLGCGQGEVPLLDNDIVQQTADGSVAAFNVELPGLDYLVLRWDGTSSHPVINGMLLGLSAAGDRVLAATDGMTIAGMDGFAANFALGMIVGRGSLSAAGDRVIGAAYPDGNGGAQLARANVSTGEIELLGEVAQTISRAYSTADGETIVGFGDNFSWTPDNPLGDADGTAFIANGDGLTLGLPGTPDGVEIWPEAVSSDGTVIAGRAATTGRHFRWTEAGGYVELAGASGRSETYLSADGAVVLGSLVPEGGCRRARSTCRRAPWPTAKKLSKSKRLCLV